MRSIINKLAIVALAAGVSACVDPAAAGVPPSEASAETIWAAPGAERAASTSIPAGWTSARVDGAPAGAVIVTAIGANAPPCPTGFACLFQNSNRGGFGYGLRAVSATATS